MNFRPVRVSAYSRIHLGLIDVGNATRRLYGGAGFSLKGFETVVDVRECTNGLKLFFDCEHELRSQSDALQAMDRLNSSTRDLRGEVVVRRIAPEHIGLGSKTALILAILKALDLANDSHFSAREIVKFSNRGGTSGVGVHAFFDGGLIVDAGHARHVDVRLGPSSVGGAGNQPLLLMRHDFPRDWDIHLILPVNLNPIAAEEEMAFFNKHAPLPDEEVLRTLAAIHHAIVPAFYEHDLRALARGLDDLSEVGFKRRELDAQPDSQRVRLLVSSAGYACGMSSVGPLVFAVADHGDSAAGITIKKLGESAGAEYLGAFIAENCGFRSA